MIKKKMTKEELLKIAKPILFNTEMVQAILDGRKTVTRRLMKIQPWDNLDGCNHELKNIFKDEPREFCCRICGLGVGPSGHSVFKAPYQSGDILYVRETFRKSLNGCYHYRADWEKDGIGYIGKWHPSIHMPKEAARIFLKVKDVRVERLQEIMEDEPGPNNQVVIEGFNYGCDFIAGWNSTIKKSDLHRYGWDANPYVWVIEFERIEV